MHRHPVVKGIKIALFVIIGAIVFGFVVKESMERSGTANLRMAHDHLLAGTWLASAEQDSLWRLPSPRRQRSRSLETANEGSLGADDSRGAREVSQWNALRPRSLRLIRGASGMNKFDTDAHQRPEKTLQYGGHKGRLLRLLSATSCKLR